MLYLPYPLSRFRSVIYDHANNWTGGRAVIRIALPFIFNLANNLEPLASLPDKGNTYSDILLTSYQAQSAVVSLIEGSLFSPYLRVSYGLGNELLTILKEITTTKK